MDVEMFPPCDHVIAGSRNFAGCGPSAYFIRLPSVVAISLLEVEIILIFNARRRIYMNIFKEWLFNFADVFDIFRISKCGKVILLQSVIDSYYKVRQLLQSVTDFIIKCVRYYEVWPKPLRRIFVQLSPSWHKEQSFYLL